MTSTNTGNLLQKQVKHLKYVFITINGFPLWVVSQVISRVENEISTTHWNKSEYCQLRTFEYQPAQTYSHL